jgi:uncharacterized protein YjbI with pentapeptide repeats
MRMTRRVYLSLVLLLSMLVLPLATIAQGNSGGNSEAAKACQGEGYLAYTDVNGNAFKNAGQCTRYVAQGNALVAVTPTPTPTPTVNCTLARAWTLESQTSLAGVNLSGCDLSGAILVRADLSYAILSGANLSGADLFHADLTGANLTGANLTGGWLDLADLTGANLTGANLTGANLFQANLFQANLTGANLSGVAWHNTTCPDGSNSGTFDDGGTC